MITAWIGYLPNKMKGDNRLPFALYFKPLRPFAPLREAN